MEWTHELREVAEASRLAARPQKTLNSNQDTAEAGGKNLESPAYSKQNDEPST
jgi:hypothetical protein